MKEVKKEKNNSADDKNTKQVKKVTEKDKNKKQKTKGNGFFKEVIKELKKVKWPDKKYMVKYSISTFAIIIVLSTYFYLIYILFTWLKEFING